MYKFKKGDKVRIDKNSEYYGRNQGSNNPKDIDGVIDELYYQEQVSDNLHKYGVRWGNMEHNSYRFKDLVLIEPKLPKTDDSKFNLKEIKKALAKYDTEDIDAIMLELEENL